MLGNIQRVTNPGRKSQKMPIEKFYFIYKVNSYGHRHPIKMTIIYYTSTVRKVNGIRSKQQLKNTQDCLMKNSILDYITRIMGD